MGKKNGLYEEYHPNGQFRYKDEMKDGYPVKDTCDYVSVRLYFDRFGDTCQFSFYAVYNEKSYSFQTTYIWGKLCRLNIFNNRTWASELRWSEKKKKWEIVDYHTRSVEYTNELLDIYIERTGIGKSGIKSKKGIKRRIK